MDVITVVRVLALCCTFRTVLSTSLRVEIYPQQPSRTEVDNTKVISILVSVVDEPIVDDNSTEVSYVPLSSEWDLSPDPFFFKLEVDYPNIVDLSERFFNVSVLELLDSRDGVNKTIEIDSWLFGYFYLDVSVHRLGDGIQSSVCDNYKLIFTRGKDYLDEAFTIIVTVSVILVSINMGCELDLQIIKSVLKHPIGPVVGFCSQFLFMPVASFAIGRLLFTDPLHRLGLFVLGTSPGGTSSNLWAVMFHADINLSITMTFISTTAALAMMPMWLLTLGRFIFPDGETINIPYVKLCTSLVSLTAPLAVGIVLRMKKPKIAEFLRTKVMKPFCLCLLIFLVSTGLYNMRHVFFLMTWRMLVAGCSVVIGGYIVGASASTLFRLKRPQIIAVALETALQNGSIPLVLLKLSLPEPESDIANIPAITQMLVTGPPLLTIYVIILLYKKIKERTKAEDDNSTTNEKGKGTITLNTDKLKAMTNSNKVVPIFTITGADEPTSKDLEVKQDVQEDARQFQDRKDGPEEKDC